MLIPEIGPRSYNNQSFFQRAAAKIGSFIPKKLSDTFEMTNKGSFDRTPLFLIALVFVLGARFYKSRDEHERREVLTRDGITVGSTFFLVPVMKNLISRGLDKFSKIPTASENKKFFSLADFSMENLKNWYSKASSMPEKALTIAKNIADRGGDVAKAFSALGEEATKNLKTIAGDDLSNKNVLAKMENAFKANDGAAKTAFNALTEALTPADNALVKTAQRFKAIPNLASMILATAFLGWGIPAFNIYFTRNKLKKETQAPLQTQTASSESVVLLSKLNEPQMQVINDFWQANTVTK